jgi:aminoglycoside phosphotransferase (APT) family kinase protein
LILKHYLRPREFAVAPVREFRALQLLVGLDLAPRPVLLDRAPGPGLGPLVVYEYMDGTMWGRRRPSAAELAQLADTWLRVHAVISDDLWLSRRSDRSWATIAAEFRARFERYAAWARSAYPPGVQAAELCLERLRHCEALGELATLAPRVCFSRADPRFANVISRPDGRLGLVDWEDSGLRDPARDVADLLTHPEQEDLLTPDAWRAFLQPYLAVQAQDDPSLQRRIDLYRAVFPLFWLSVLAKDGVERSERGAATSWTVNGMPVNQRLRRYLARALAWPDESFTVQLADLRGVSFFG